MNQIALQDTPMQDLSAAKDSTMCEEGAELDDELCTICYTSELSSEQCVTLKCGHRFHLGCVRQLLGHKWSTLRISFGFMLCPQCKAEIKAAELDVELESLNALKVQIEQQALKVARSQGLDRDERLNGQTDEAALLALAMQQCTFYQCTKCEKPYFGGMQDCQAQLGLEESSTTKEDLLCKEC